MPGPGLPTNIDATYGDSSVDGSATLHQQYHDAVHNIVNKFDTALGTATVGHVLKWTGSLYAPATESGGATGDNFVHPEDFYEGGDVNDGEAVQRAIDSLGPNEAVALVPGKNYVSTRQIVVHSGCTIYGNGATITGGSTVTGICLRLQDESPTLVDLHVVAGASVAIAVTLAGNTQHAKIYGGSISGLATNGADQGLGINSTGIDHVLVMGVRFKHCGYGILTNQLATDLTDVQIVGCVFDDISGDPIELNHPGTAGTGLRECVISGNYIRARAASDTSGLPGSPSAGFGVGIAHCNNVTITGNTFYDCRQKGVHIEDTARDIVVTGNTFRNCTEAIWALGVDTLVISNNTFRGGTYGIHLTFDVVGAGHWVEKAIIANNQISGTSNTAICHESDHNPLLSVVGNMLTGNTGKGLEVNVPGSGTVNYLVVGNMITGNTGAETLFVGIAGTVASNIIV